MRPIGISTKEAKAMSGEMPAELKQAYQTVIKDLKVQGRCKEYNFSCFECQTAKLAKELQAYYEFVQEYKIDIRSLDIIQLGKQLVMLKDLSALMAENRISNGSYLHESLKVIIREAEEYLRDK